MREDMLPVCFFLLFPFDSFECRQVAGLAEMYIYLSGGIYYDDLNRKRILYVSDCKDGGLFLQKAMPFCIICFL